MHYTNPVTLLRGSILCKIENPVKLRAFIFVLNLDEQQILIGPLSESWQIIICDTPIKNKTQSKDQNTRSRRDRCCSFSRPINTELKSNDTVHYLANGQLSITASLDFIYGSISISRIAHGHSSKFPKFRLHGEDRVLLRLQYFSN